MAKYVYSALNVNGQKINGEKTAKDLNELKRFLKREKMVLIKANKKGFFESFDFSKGKKIKAKQITILTRQLATMIGSGVPLLRSISIIAGQAENERLRDVVDTIKFDLTSGISLSQSVSKFPKQFNNLFTNMVKAGEASGSLDTVLERLANSMEKAEAIKGKVKNAMVYPIVVLVIAFSILFLLLTFVIPQFVKMFNDSGIPLPLITRMVVGASDWMVANWWLVIIAIIGGIYGFKKYRGTAKGKRSLDTIALKLPLFGKLNRKVAVAKFTRTMATLLDSGVPILSAFDIVADIVGNDLIKDAVVNAKSSIKEGNTIARPLHESEQFPLMVINMIEIGEESGTLVEMLEKVANYNEREVEEEISNMLAAMEPLVILIMAIMVGTIVIALFLPMFSLSDVVVD